MTHAAGRPRCVIRSLWRIGSGMFVMLLIVWGCVNGPLYRGDTTPPVWMNRILTVQETATITPEMSAAERLTVLRQAKRAVYDQLRSSLVLLGLEEQKTIEDAMIEQPELSEQIEAYMAREAEIETTWDRQSVCSHP